MSILLADFVALFVKLIGHALNKKHAEDVFFEFGGIHLATEDVCGFEEERFELAECDFFLRHVLQFVRS